MKYIAVCTLIGSVLLSLTTALQCRSGYETKIGDFPPRSLWESIQCGDGERCFRGEGEAIAFGVILDFSGGACVGSDACVGPCRNVLSTTLNSDPDADGINRFVFRTCDRVCCDTDNCNNGTIAQIRASTEESRPSTPGIEPSSRASITTMQTETETVTVEKNSETTQTTDVYKAVATDKEYSSTASVGVSASLTCSTGYELSSGVSDFRFVECPSHANFACIQQELLVELPTGFYENVTIRACASSEDCEGSCEEVGRVNVDRLTILGSINPSPVMGRNFRANSCRQECCSGNLCNYKVEPSSYRMESTIESRFESTPSSDDNPITMTKQIEETTPTAAATKNSINASLMCLTWIYLLCQLMC